MHFFEPGRLIFLWLLPLIFLLFVWGNKTREKRLTLLGNPHFMKEKLIRGISEDARRLSWAFLLLAFFFSILALARPQWGEEKRKVERKGVDLVFLLDTSLSMLAEDVKPNRLGKAKLEMKNMIRKLKGDRVGMVAFAGSSFLQCPLTLDYGAFLLFVDALKPGYIPDPGTSLSNALRLAVRAFPQDSNKYRAIIIFSDGEDHEGGVDQAIEEAKKAGIRVYAVGVGTPEGDPIPLRSGLGPQQGPNITTGYKKDKQGQVVITRLNPEILSRIAKETGGLYLQATPGEREIDVVLKHLETLGQRKLKERLITEREDHFQIFLFLAFLFLAVETLLRYYKKRQILMKAVLPLFILFLFSGFMDSPHSLVEKGNRAVEDKKYQTAVESYRKAQVTDPSNPVIRYDLGTALYHQYEYRGAEKELQQALSQVKDPKEKTKILYNYANTLYRLGDFEKAIQNYKKVLEIDPKDEDAKYNLEFLQKKKAQFEKQNQERQKQQKQNPQQNPQQNQQQQQGQQSQEQQEQSQPQSGNGQDDKQNSQSEQQNKDQQKKNEGGNPSNQNQQDQEREQEKQEGSQKPDDHEGQEQEKEDLEKSGQGTQTKEEEQQQKEKKGDNLPEPQPESQQEQPQQGSGQEEEQPQVDQAQPTKEQSLGQGSSEDQPQGEKSDQQTNPQAQQPLQGQMSKENALRILDALREGDKQLQDVRHPTRPGNSREVLKDW